MSEKETTFINKCSIKEHEFDNGDSVLIYNENSAGAINVLVLGDKEG